MLRRVGALKVALSQETEANLFERLLLSEESIRNIRDRRAQKLFNELMQLIHEIIPHLGEIVGCVLSHYRKRITFAYTDINSVFDDLKSECYIGLVKGLIRISSAYANDYQKIYRYLMKVVRSHIKNTLSLLLLSARVPQSRWYALNHQEKNNLVPIPFSQAKNGDSENGNEEENNDLLCEPFPQADVEFKDFIKKLPEPYRYYTEKLVEGSIEMPPIFQKILALYSLLLFQRLAR